MKFKNWRKLVPEKDLKKEILGIYNTYRESLKAEEKFIGDKYKTDPECLNFIAGGRFSPTFKNRLKVEILTCSIHGEVKHQGGICCTCTSQKILIFKIVQFMDLLNIREMYVINVIHKKAFLKENVIFTV